MRTIIQNKNYSIKEKKGSSAEHDICSAKSINAMQHHRFTLRNKIIIVTSRRNDRLCANSHQKRKIRLAML